jgi:hypothetical protein
MTSCTVSFSKRRCLMRLEKRMIEFLARTESDVTKDVCHRITEGRADLADIPKHFA